MEDIFGENNYRFGVESFLLMYLSRFQFVLGADLENYDTKNGVFGEDNPCHIYFVLRRPKISVEPKSFKFEGKKAWLDIIIHGQESNGITTMGFEFKKAESTLEFNSEYPYNLFSISDKNGVLLGARPSSVLDNSQVLNNIISPALDYEILYIGQAYGKNGERTAIERLSAHETVQKIYTHSSTQHPNSDIWILLTRFTQQSMLMMAGSSLINVSEEDSKIEEKKINHMFENEGLSFTEKQKINFTEAALIKYFEPKYNIEFKGSFPSNKHKSYSECYGLDVRALTIELDTSEMTRNIFTEKSGRKSHHMEMYEFNSDEDRISLLGFNNG